MTTRTEALAAADAADAAGATMRAFIAAAGESGEPPASAPWPQPLDCLAGVPAAGYPGFAPQDGGYWYSRKQSLQRMQGNVRPGSIAFIGDSIFEGMAVQTVHPAAVGLAIAGEPTLGTVNRLGAMTCLHQAGGVVLLIGINDLTDPARNWSCVDMMAKILGWLSGPLVVVLPWRVDPLSVQPAAREYANPNVLYFNGQVAAMLAGRPRCQVIDGDALMVDPATGFMRASWCAGGPHPSTAGYGDGLIPAIAARLPLVLAA